MSSGMEARAFRLPPLTYLAVLFLLIGCAPVAFTGRGGSHVGVQTLVLLVPAAAAVFIARWATVVGARGITVRALFSARLLAWDDVEGLAVSGRTVYAVTADGSWRLPCVHVNNLAALSRASGGRLPEIADPTPKYAPQRRRRR